MSSEFFIVEFDGTLRGPYESHGAAVNNLRVHKGETITSKDRDASFAPCQVCKTWRLNSRLSTTSICLDMEACKELHKKQDQIEQLKAANELLSLTLCKIHHASNTDLRIPEEDEIDEAFPTRSGRHDLYAQAATMVGAKYTKAGLIALVNMLLHRIDKATKKLARIEKVCQTDDDPNARVKAWEIAVGQERV